MALYSKEYYQLTEQSLIPDFSILDEFQLLTENQSIDIICEGFGVTKVINRSGVCFVQVMGKVISFEELTIM